ncbi:hypothetical protein CEXT_127361 [Caerostris extrusa]|uniref:Uncharacterized protein n=1 Tax=Caerostris extrusa TaxID=172846 RepID=A0AAV4Y0Q1_CAEEX|nr:hypothetical protein CEXT_127361 [Caerostris extrusa]
MPGDCENVFSGVSDGSSPFGGLLNLNRCEYLRVLYFLGPHKNPSSSRTIFQGRSVCEYRMGVNWVTLSYHVPRA